MCLDVKVNLDMPRTKSKAMLEDNGSTHQDKSTFGGLTREEILTIRIRTWISIERQATSTKDLNTWRKRTRIHIV